MAEVLGRHPVQKRGPDLLILFLAITKIARLEVLFRDDERSLRGEWLYELHVGQRKVYGPTGKVREACDTHRLQRSMSATAFDSF